MRWKIQGYESGNPTSFSREESASEATIELLLERLIARNLTDDEITDATLRHTAHFTVNRDKQRGKPLQLMTTGNPYYVAIEVISAPRP